MYDQIREKRSQILERAGLLVLLSLPSAGQIFAGYSAQLLWCPTAPVVAQSRCQSAAQLAFTLQWIHVVHLMHVTHSAGKTDLRQAVVFLETRARTQRSIFANGSLRFVNPKMFSLCSCQELRQPQSEMSPVQTLCGLFKWINQPVAFLPSFFFGFWSFLLFVFSQRHI